MSWRGPAFSVILIGFVYWGVRPLFVAALTLELYLVGLIVCSFLTGVATAWWQASNADYACENCAHIFDVSVPRHLIGQDWFGRVRTQCPSCEQIILCTPSPRESPSSDKAAGT